ncbi:MAG: hypothetical protein IPK83_04450 [Planctomycetes bacterium]|nr:hypothetical protein [Planctomycetota bacterium]
MARYYFACHPADLLDEGVDDAFARLRGEIGVDGVVIDAVAPARLALRPRIAQSPKIASHEAAAWFQPDSKCYSATRLRPNAAKAIKARNAMAQLCNEAASQGLAVRLRIDPLENGVLTDRNATAACVDVFGRPHDSRLCPSNPDVREYVASLVEDVSTNFVCESVELANVDFGAGLYARCDPVHGFDVSAMESMLLGWCFCSACRQRAAERDVDVDETVSAVQAHLSRIFELQPVEAASRFVEQNAHLAGYRRSRIETVTSLMKMIRRRAKRPLHLRASGDSLEAGFDCEAVADCCDGFVLAKPCGGKPPAMKMLTLEIACHPPETADGPALVSAVHDASGGKYTSICFSEYGAAPEPCLEWVRQAIRFARRESA